MFPYKYLYCFILHIDELSVNGIMLSVFSWLICIWDSFLLMCIAVARFHCFRIFHCMNILHFIHLFSYWWAFGLFSVMCYSEQNCIQLQLHMCKSSSSEITDSWNVPTYALVANAKLFSNLIVPIPISIWIPISPHFHQPGIVRNLSPFHTLCSDLGF